MRYLERLLLWYAVIFAAMVVAEYDYTTEVNRKVHGVVQVLHYQIPSQVDLPSGFIKLDVRLRSQLLVHQELRLAVCGEEMANMLSTSVTEETQCRYMTDEHKSCVYYQFQPLSYSSETVLVEVDTYIDVQHFQKLVVLLDACNVREDTICSSEYSDQAACVHTNTSISIRAQLCMFDEHTLVCLQPEESSSSMETISSADQERLKYYLSYIRFVVGGLWIAIATVYHLHVIAKASQSSRMPVILQKRLCAVAFLVGVYNLFDGASVLVVHENPKGSAIVVVWLIPSVVTGLSFTTYMSAAELVLLLAKGWQITRLYLPPRETFRLRLLVAGYALSATLVEYLGLLYTIVNMALFLSYLAIVCLFWFQASLHVRLLAEQVSWLQQVTREVSLTPAYVKHQLFQRLRLTMAMYFIVSSIATTARQIFHDENAMSGLLSEEMLYCTAVHGFAGVVTAILLGYTFRCREFRRLLPPDENIQANNNAVIQVAPATVAPEAKATVVVVVNPDSDRMLGVDDTGVAAKPSCVAPN